MRRHVYVLILIIAVGLTLAGCKKASPVKGVEVAVTFAEPALTDNLITDVTYAWKTGDDFLPLDKDYSVFVHYWHNENMLLRRRLCPRSPHDQMGKGENLLGHEADLYP